MNIKDLKKLTKKQKYIIGATSMIIVAGCIGGGVYASQFYYPKLELKTDTIEVEYGNPIDIHNEDLIANMDKIDPNMITIQNNIENETDKDYPAIGDYTIKLVYKNRTTPINVSIKDTTAPTVEAENIALEQGTELTDEMILDNLLVTDKSTYETTIDKSNVDTNTPGEYVVTATVKDSSGNEVTKEVNVVVTEKPMDEIIDSVSSSKPNINKRPATKPSTNGPSLQEQMCVCNKGNTGMWFNSKEEAEAKYDEVLKKLVYLVHSNQMTMEEYKTYNSTSGYAVWTCYAHDNVRCVLQIHSPKMVEFFLKNA